ncbi:hypothetical protein GCM10010377_79820 [Streptomyces viridiviolaceus]|uniref:Uncharacterized protein n=1 Tax=Streptomyces viridiviolaceus TaxID=68282 RepID=A0ABW2DY67_9ACTN|nr:hypothetical protein [Streptomyces viridiviolaceus]GHB77594.1 hypothetical protein GCM10010377_79820 [Streptomyces viridiviolaceus]
MKPLELAELLTAPTQHPVREALRELAPRELDALVIEALAATEEAWRQVVVSRVKAFTDGQPGDGRPAVAVYFTTTERRAADGMHLGWSPFIAALANTEAVPDLRPTRTTVTAAPVGEAAPAEEIFADPELAAALNRRAALDPPGHEDVLRVHLPTREVTRISR